MLSHKYKASEALWTQVRSGGGLGVKKILSSKLRQGGIGQGIWVRPWLKGVGTRNANMLRRILAGHRPKTLTAVSLRNDMSGLHLVCCGEGSVSLWGPSDKVFVGKAFAAVDGWTWKITSRFLVWCLTPQLLQMWFARWQDEASQYRTAEVGAPDS